MIDALNRIAGKQPEIVADAENCQAGKTYLCLEENSPALYPDAENINHLFLTNNREQVKNWVDLSLAKAEKNQYKPLFEEDTRDFEADLEAKKSTKLWMYKNGKEDSPLFYGVCVYVFDLNQPQEVETVFEGGEAYER